MHIKTTFDEALYLGSLWSYLRTVSDDHVIAKATAGLTVSLRL